MDKGQNNTSSNAISNSYLAQKGFGRSIVKMMSQKPNQSMNHNRKVVTYNTAGESININILKKQTANSKYKKKAASNRVETKPYYDYEDELVDLNDFVGTFDNIQPAFGYPLFKFQDNHDDEDVYQQQRRSQSLNKNQWNEIKQRLDPLKDMVLKAYRTDTAFDQIYKSFTYGKKLIRKKISALQKEKNRIKEEMRNQKEEEERMLSVLTEKKGKSIAGDIADDRHIFKVENDLLENNVNEFNIKLITHISHKNFTYFRNQNDFNLSSENNLNSEQLKQLREIAANKGSAKNKNQRKSVITVETEEEAFNVRDSFSIDYNPDYEKEFLKQDLQQKEEIESVQNLTKMALSKLSQKENFLKNRKKVSGSVISYQSKQTLRGKLARRKVVKINDDNSNKASTQDNPNESLSQSSKILSNLTGSAISKANQLRSQSTIRSTYTRHNQQMLETKIKEFKDKLTHEQISNLYERSFTVREIKKSQSSQNGTINKIDSRYNFRDFRQILGQNEQQLNKTASAIQNVNQNQEALYSMIQSQMSQVSRPVLNLKKRFQLVTQRLEEKANSGYQGNHQLLIPGLQPYSKFDQSSNYALTAQSTTKDLKGFYMNTPSFSKNFLQIALNNEGNQKAWESGYLNKSRNNVMSHKSAKSVASGKTISKQFNTSLYI